MSATQKNLRKLLIVRRILENKNVCNPEKDTKQKHGVEGVHINLKVKSQDGTEVVFRIEKSTHLKKLMNAYDF